MPWGFETFAEYLGSLTGNLGINVGMYVGHSALRRWVMGDDAFARASTPAELEAICELFAEAMADGSLGLSSSHAPTHLDMADRPVPSRLASLDEMRALADVQGRTGVGSIAYAPGSAVEGIDAADRDLLIELAAPPDLATERAHPADVAFGRRRGPSCRNPAGELLREAAPPRGDGRSDGGAHLAWDDGAEWSPTSSPRGGRAKGSGAWRRPSAS